jgi:hypothetical protein
MSTRLWCCVALLGIAASGDAMSSRTGLAEDKERENPRLIDFSPRGKPMKLDHPGVNVYLWTDGEGFHFRGTGHNKNGSLHTGEIRVQGGKVTSLRNLGGLEGAKKKKKPPQDLGWLSPDKKILRYKFKTRELVDGFDFEVSGENSEVTFDLKVDGTDLERRIHIGRDGKHP